MHVLWGVNLSFLYNGGWHDTCMYFYQKLPKKKNGEYEKMRAAVSVYVHVHVDLCIKMGEDVYKIIIEVYAGWIYHSKSIFFCFGDKKGWSKAGWLLL